MDSAWENPALMPSRVLLERLAALRAAIKTSGTPSHHERMPGGWIPSCRRPLNGQRRSLPTLAMYDGERDD